jgi:hypothetical protein
MGKDERILSIITASLIPHKDLYHLFLPFPP